MTEEEIPNTQIPSQLMEDDDSDDNNNPTNNSSSEDESTKKDNHKKHSNKEGSDNDDNDNDDDDDLFGDNDVNHDDDNNNKSDKESDKEEEKEEDRKDNDGDESDDDESDDDIFGDNSNSDSDSDKDSKHSKKRPSKLKRGDQTSTQPPKKKSNIVKETDILSEIERAEKIDLVRQQLPSDDYESYIIQLPPSVDIQKNVYDSQKYELKDPKKFLRHTIRWRRTPGNKATRESNARFVRWSDGSLTLNIGATAIPVGTTNLPGFNMFGIRSNGRIEAHTTVSQKLKVYNPHDAMESSLAKSRSSIARLVEESINELNQDSVFETSIEERRSRRAYGKESSRFSNSLTGEEYDQDLNESDDEKQKADSIRDAKSSKKKQRR